MPRQIPFIIGNEACERFSFYGMRNVLTDFLVGYLLISLAETDRQPAAKEVFHVFVMGVYFFPLLGGWLSDRFLGKYRVIFWLSIVYCVGQVLLAFSIDSKEGFYAGLFLIALAAAASSPASRPSSAINSTRRTSTWRRWSSTPSTSSSTSARSSPRC